MKYPIAIVATLGLMFSGVALQVRADEPSSVVASDAKFFVELNVDKFFASTLGTRIKSLTKQSMAGADRSDKKSDSEAPFEKIVEMIGFDPFAEIQTIGISSSEFDEPENSFVITCQMKSTTGNLEGLVMGLPGYESSEYGKYQIHSLFPVKFTPPADPNQKLSEEELQADANRFKRVFAAIHSGASKEKLVVLATQKELLTSYLDHLDGKAEATKKMRVVAGNSDAKSMLSVQVFEVPKNLGLQGPQSNVVKLFKSMVLQVVDGGSNCDVSLKIATATEKQAEQLRQMAQGLSALIELAQSMDSEDKDLANFTELLKGIKAEKEGSNVNASLSLPWAKVLALLEDSVGKSLSNE